MCTQHVWLANLYRLSNKKAHAEQLRKQTHDFKEQQTSLGLYIFTCKAGQQRASAATAAEVTCLQRETSTTCRDGPPNSLT